jgi:hypothetical protein
MARTRTLAELRADAYLRADTDSAEDRHKPADVNRYVSQGLSELYDMLVEARGRTYYRKRPALTVTTDGETTAFPLPEDFYRLISIRVAGSGGLSLAAFGPEDEPMLREPSAAVTWPTHYELQAGHIEVLPLPKAGVELVVEYVPTCPVLAADGATFDGVNGWEEFAAMYAAKCMATRDEDWEVVAALSREMERMKERIVKLAPTRDAFRPERVKDVRGARWWLR